MIKSVLWQWHLQALLIWLERSGPVRYRTKRMGLSDFLQNLKLLIKQWRDGNMGPEKSVNLGRWWSYGGCQHRRFYYNAGFARSSRPINIECLSTIIFLLIISCHGLVQYVLVHTFIHKTIFIWPLIGGKWIPKYITGTWASSQNDCAYHAHLCILFFTLYMQKVLYSQGETTQAFRLIVCNKTILHPSLFIWYGIPSTMQYKVVRCFRYSKGQATRLQLYICFHFFFWDYSFIKQTVWQNTLIIQLDCVLDFMYLLTVVGKFPIFWHASKHMIRMVLLFSYSTFSYFTPLTSFGFIKSKITEALHNTK